MEMYGGNIWWKNLVEIFGGNIWWKYLVKIFGGNRGGGLVARERTVVKKQPFLYDFPSLPVLNCVT